MNKPIVVEKYTDNGEHSHWDLIDADTGETLWTGGIEQLHKPDVGGHVCPNCQSDDLFDVDDHWTRCNKCNFQFVG